MSKFQLSCFHEGVLHLVISGEKEASSIEISPGITAEFNESGELIGIEILSAKTASRDPIVEETRKRRDELAQKYGYSLDAICQAMQEKEAATKVIASQAKTGESVEPVAIRAWTKKRMIFIELSDGRIVGFPADRFAILKSAATKQLTEVELRLGGQTLRWENLDEDIRVSGILAGNFQLPPADNYKVSEPATPQKATKGPKSSRKASRQQR